MQLLQKTLSEIKPLSNKAKQEAQEFLRSVLANCGGEISGNSYLTEMIIQYAGIREESCPQPPQKCIILAAADHGIARLGISAYPMETTVQMTKSYLLGKGGNANAMANFCGAELVVVDVGIAGDLSDLPGLVQKKIACGTQDFTQGPAMSREQAIKAIEIGIELVQEKAAAGCHCFSLSEMGIGNTASNAAVVAALAQVPPEIVTGRGTGISDERLKIKIEVVKKGLALNRPDPNDALDVLAKLGGFETGALVGVVLGAAACRAVVVIDGFNAGVAALLAFFLNPLSKNYLLPSHLGKEQGHAKVLEILGLKPYLSLGIGLGEASGAALGVDFLSAALEAMRHLKELRKT
ncbi:MAG: nicotinate-nucleotide--dimethylbenzimidazole phosphoribosyltransferase [Sporomusaceae bacterium]|nr:nicotinate-nucleotide--dimethylbenzimidazole phosphoribosyltransferase [Sporomusaceae bacterium]